ncbi:N-acetylmuramoyl-L-alanine amidase family protein [Cyclobacterium jeungdonense]|uniref:N-acetylmuramoyl-L-alanine amidase n=1 Tax=Cyclobacterium jeungdonense TaxID=708087 RepID=A0ABT8C6S1_9BACT|nr:N-acetylmuramoyl-L-alanine amidase [Cyclobacterium jeungdonense]MDN3687328.1 N-acetylmuramoyl-L-alanine amidase [Cyclobacterium jeungdonense]
MKHLSCFPLIALSVILLLAGSVFALPPIGQLNERQHTDSIKGKVIILDPGHGGTAATDSYRVGPTGEREEWVNLRVALYLKDMLERAGGEVLLTRAGDVFVPLEERSQLALHKQADLFVSIHHNATADRSVNFPIIYFHGSATENLGSVLLGKEIAVSLRKHLFKDKGPYSLVSDYTIFSKSGASVLRGTYGIPAVIGEATFFTHPKEEKRLKREAYNRKEARAYFEAIAAFFSEIRSPILEKNLPLKIPPFEVFQEAERMRPEALQWKENFQEAKRLYETGSSENKERAMSLLDLCVKSFPDSYLARECHVLRATILEEQGKLDESAMEFKRLEAYYPEN